MRSGHVSKELWGFHLDTLAWEKVEVKRGRCNSRLCGEIHTAGHTATTVENRMIVIFGHSPRLGYLDTVQEFHFGTEEWSIIETNGYPVKGGYGHSAVLDELTNKIYVHGGYISKSNVQSLLSDQLYSFDHQHSRWELLTAASSYRYLHTATMSNGLMLVFGGNTHNDTQFSMGAKCYSADFMAYDIQCDRWYSMEANIPRDFSADVPRFGHSALSINQTILVFAGFNGQTKSDILAYKSGSCSYIKKNRKECLNSRNGVKCVWNSKKEVCEALSKDALKRSSLEICGDLDQYDNNRNRTSVCQSQSSCNSCLSTSLGCVWCNDKCHHQECPMKKEVKATSRLSDCGDPSQGAKEICNNLHTCDGCSAIARCGWSEAQGQNGLSCRASMVGDGGNDSDEGGSWGEDKGSACKQPCSERKNCGNCTQGSCMWCHNQQMCVDRNAYLAAFPYGQCMDWTTDFANCKDQDATGLPDLCKGFDTCNDCHTNPACGWCDLGSVTGLGKCLEGGASSPLRRMEGLKIKKHWTFEPSDVCSAEDNGWHFTTCPSCQCNGHSNCTEKGKCNKPCQHNTQGDHCQRCTDGFFGNPVNGGDCKKCECNGQGTLCDNKSGNCFCTTKGITGNHCEKCDTQNHYFGDPIKESCFYDLAIDYQFTFNLSKPEDKHYTAINFKNVPTKPEVDVDFSIACSVPAKMNLTFRHAGKDGVRTEDVIITEKNCSQFKYRFPKSEYTFGNEENTTFYVYLYDFTPPLWIIISFSQHPKLDLLQFFITFSTCFLALLIIAAILWKIKQKYDRYRRRQRLYVEMEQMASRPFGQVLVELERIPDTAETHHHARKRKKKHRPSPIALEPCDGNRAAVLSLIVRMPTGSCSYSPAGLPGVAIASSLVTLGNPRKVSLDPTAKVEEQPKNSRKRRKVSANNQATDL